MARLLISPKINRMQQESSNLFRVLALFYSAFWHSFIPYYGKFILYLIVNEINMDLVKYPQLNTNSNIQILNFFHFFLLG